MTRLLATTRPLAAVLFAAFALAACDSVDSLSEVGVPDADAPGFVSGETVMSNGPSVRQRAGKVTLCHYDADTDSYKAISVSNRAYAAHMNHGDGIPGAPVPTAPGSIFDDVCRPVPDSAPFACEVERGTNAAGQHIMNLRVRVPDVPRIAKGRGDYPPPVNAVIEDRTNDWGWIWDEAGANIVGAWATFTQIDPAQPAVASLLFTVFTEPKERYPCGPFTFGAP